MSRRDQPDRAWQQHVLGQLPRMEQATGTTPVTGLTPGPVTDAVAPTPFSADFHVAPGFDPIELLPPAAADKLRLLRERSREKHAVMIPHTELQEAITERTLAEQNLRRLQAHPQDGGFALPPSDARVVAAEKQVARTSDNVRRLQERSEKLAAAWRAASQSLTGCEDFLRHGVPGGCKLEAAPEVEPTLHKGEAGLLDAIENRRRRVREIKASIHTIESAPFPSTAAKALLREAVEILAQRGKPDVSTLIEFGERGSVIWPTLRQQAEVHGAEQRALAFHEAVDVVGLLAFFLKPTVLSVLDGLVDEEQDDPASLSDADREARISEAQADLLATEFDEAALVFAAWGHGLVCEQRGDCSVLALLGLKLVTVPRAAPPPSSPERASYNLTAGGRR